MYCKRFIFICWHVASFSMNVWIWTYCSICISMYEFSLSWFLDLSSIIEVDDSLSTLQMISALQVRVSHFTIWAQRNSNTDPCPLHKVIFTSTRTEATSLAFCKKSHVMVLPIGYWNFKSTSPEDKVISTRPLKIVQVLGISLQESLQHGIFTFLLQSF